MTTLPKSIRPGDTIGVIAPASPPNKEKTKIAINYFEQLGFNVVTGNHIYTKSAYLAGDDNKRLEDLHMMFANENIDAVYCACGGYGTARIADFIDYELIRRNPKVFWGYSDITFLHTAIFQKTGLITFHGPMLGSDLGEGSIDPLTENYLKQVIEPTDIHYTEQISPLQVHVEGKASGPVVGGNLSLLVSTLGTPFEIDTKGKLLFIEEIEEEPYRIDRMLNQLRMAGKFQDAAGVLLGDFNNCVPGKRKESFTLEQIFEQLIVPAGKPTMSGFSIGHCVPHISIPIGSQAVLSTYNKTLDIKAGCKK
ncbi:S66 peptidase family protein [Pseudalkalibacillus caeni]|uniref:LD-carboxypeptidase n=1 Tax=Exobacillus caeni TaxID=2574798 RepID=A0A5R9FD33_9BACL|nr:LD-carboxypeptidase [Pseudalkalibacillus caeni]TLS37565.1 LD-carboxypeptidase [Pseudalkalibacillus caeni]